jgi:hypothetical protein
VKSRFQNVPFSNSTCAATNRQLKAKRPRKVKKDGSPKTKEEIASVSVAKRRRAAAPKAPAAAAAAAAAAVAAVTTNASVQLHEDTTAVTDAVEVHPQHPVDPHVQQIHARMAEYYDAEPVHPGGDAANDDMLSLVDGVATEVLAEHEEEREERAREEQQEGGRNLLLSQHQAAAAATAGGWTFGWDEASGVDSARDIGGEVHFL